MRAVLRNRSLPYSTPGSQSGCSFAIQVSDLEPAIDLSPICSIGFHRFPQRTRPNQSRFGAWRTWARKFQRRGLRAPVFLFIGAHSWHALRVDYRAAKAGPEIGD